ncbi:hypothetical protein G6N74_29415 [Mesorhizobium sp. CGMCC 1.15528]|uniref:Uncharacterized protein n=1 Tax=Mesorhizobium zhangyense TaxID=1776730 RepID=A0A7C9RC51_9HYPH|nr:hypothetical protein [Mesorhizobium zhangyense]NGN45175.1 hypothetical protein [Mesorhizobium zhangyense]
MKIKMLIGLSGNEYSLAPGDERDFPQDEAIRLIQAGYAILAADVTIERAVSTPVIEKRKKGKPDVVSTEGDDSAVGGADIAGRGEAAS